MNKTIAFWTSAGLASGFVIGYITCKYFNRKCRTEMLIKSEKPDGDLHKTSSKCFEEVVRRNNDVYNAAENFPELVGNKTLMARHLTKETYSQLYNLKTPLGFTIDQAIQIGLDNPEKNGCGVLAGDEYCYDLFSSLFDPVISERHLGFTRSYGIVSKPIKTLSDEVWPFDSKYVKSSYFLIARCLHGFRFPPACSRAERNHIELLLKTTLLGLKGKNVGTYISLSQMTTDVKATLPDKLQTASKIAINHSLTPDASLRGRGIYYNAQLNFIAWINFEDHLRIMFCNEESNLIESYRKFQSAMIELETLLFEKNLTFAIHCDYGYLLPCPSGIGSALRAAVSVNLPRTIRHEGFHELVKNLRLHLGAEDRDALKKGWVDVYNKDRLGFTEAELLHQVSDAVHKLCEIEKKLEADRSFSDVRSFKSILDK